MSQRVKHKKQTSLLEVFVNHKSMADYVALPLNTGTKTITMPNNNIKIIGNAIAKCKKDISQCQICEHFVADSSGMKI